MNGKTLLPDPSLIKLERFVSSPDAVTVVVKTIQPQALCSLCQQPSRQIHSRYLRKITDLPWQSVSVRLQLTVRRFFCTNDNCERKIFAESLPSVVNRYARKTARLNDALAIIGFAIGGEVGSRVARQLAMAASPDTLLRRIRHALFVERPTPRVLGVDDWAYKRGRTYGTILIDLERRQPVDLLRDRDAQALKTWLEAHPGVEIISRDRSPSYADAARQAAPCAIQIADRWHLLKNLRDTFERLLTRKHSALKQAFAEARNRPQEMVEETAVEDRSDLGPTKPSRSEQESRQRRERRLARYQAVKDLFQQGATIRAIAQQFGMHRRTVRLFVRAESFPERAKPQKRWSKVGKFEAYLKQRWAAGCQNATRLYTELIEQGFRGSESTVRRVVKPWRAKRQSGRGQAAQPAFKQPSARKTVWLLAGQIKEPKAEETAYAKRLAETSPEIKTAQALMERFYDIVRGRKIDELAGCLRAMGESKLPEFEGFVGGLRQDLEAVKAALKYEWSNGQTEGQVNRLKMIKRQMYGRANFDLLRARVLQAP